MNAAHKLEPPKFVPVILKKSRRRYCNAHQAKPSPYSQAWENHKKKSFKLRRFLGLKAL